MTCSLLIPIYNEEHYLPLLIESIRNSSILPDEILFCDNRSTDNSVNIIKQKCIGLPYRIYTQNKKGILPTIEKLWRKASGDILLKVDGDCILPHDWILNTLNHFEQNPSLSACTGPLLAPDGPIIQKYFMNFVYKYIVPLYQSFRGYTLIHGANGAFRKSVMQKIHGYTWSTNGLDDQIISLKLYQHGYIATSFDDMAMYHSIKRFYTRPIAYIEGVLSLLNPSYYKEE